MSKNSVYFKVDKLDNDHKVKEIKQMVDQLDGIISVSVSRKDSRVAVDYNDTGTNTSEIANVLIDNGYNITIDNNKYIED